MRNKKDFLREKVRGLLPNFVLLFFMVTPVTGL
jgi:hypothetical protein